MAHLPLCVVVMGVSGAGKSTIGAALAGELGCTFLDGDDFHPKENIGKMKSGKPLSDADRRPWLKTLHDVMQQHAARGQRVVLACSALKSCYRRELIGQLDATQIGFVLLAPSKQVLQQRLEERSQGGCHFMPCSLLDSQLETLEVDSDFMIATFRDTEACSNEEELPLPSTTFPSKDQIIHDLVSFTAGAAAGWQNA